MFTEGCKNYFVLFFFLLFHNNPVWIPFDFGVMKTGLLLFEIMSPLSSAPHHSHDYLCSSLTNSKSKHSDNKSSILNLIQHVNGHIQHLSTWLQCSGSYSKKNQVHRLHAEQRWSWTEMATSVFLTCSSLHSCDTMHLFEELLREPERKHCFF